MCGFGLLCDENADIDAVQTAFARIAHRGPDDARFDVSNHIYAAFYRLTIINLLPSGMQPFHVGGYVCVCNGELYNYQDLVCEKEQAPGSDVDVLIRYCLNHKDDLGAALRALDGDFAFACCHETSHHFLAARDPVGLVPMYYGKKNGKIAAFASEAKALQGLCEDICFFPPGCFFNGTEIQPYTDIYDTPSRPLPLRELLECAVSKRVLHTQRPLAILCSGGIDSSIILTLATQLFPDRRIHAFTAFYDHRSEDSVYAELLFQQLPNVTVTHVPISKADITAVFPEMPMVFETDDAPVLATSASMFLLARYIRDHTDFKVVLSGEGADEIFGGYNYMKKAPTAAACAEECVRLVKQLHAFDIRRAERCFAAHGMELRCPFLDRDVLRNVLTEDGSQRMDGRKTMLRNAVADIPALVQSRVLQRTKLGMSQGIGWSFIGELMCTFCPDDGSSLDASIKQRKQQELCTKWFLEAYPEGAKWLIPREMPTWVSVKNVSKLSFIR
jgi:asparagine synthase (glutamine-hydrolysing)